MNLGRPMGRLTRAMLSHTGWPTFALATIASSLILYAGGIFPDAATPMWRDTILSLRWPWHRGDLILHEAAFVAAVWLWIIACAWYIFRTVARLSVRWRRQRPPIYSRQAKWRRLAFALLFLISTALALFGWPMRAAKSLVAHHGMGTQWVDDLPDDKQEVAYSAGVVHMRTPAARREQLARLVALSPDTARILLPTAIARERDPALRADEIHTLTLYHDPATADLLVKWLDDPEPLVRAAAADGVGYLRSAGFRPPKSPWYGRQLVLNTEPSINADRIVFPRGRFDWIQNESDVPTRPAVTFAVSVRGRLEAMMVDGPSQHEREAAARTLVNWPPQKYSLRLAEWGVWTSERGDLKFVQQIIDEIPPFVHRIGNTYDSLRDRYLYWGGGVFKPIVHLTVDQRLAIDIEVHLHQGRPLFAYPKPDDLALAHRGRFAGSVEMLDPKDVPPLTDLREGYPWILPKHRLHPLESSSSGKASVRATRVEASELGVRWQSLIALPQPARWMKLAPLPSDRRYHWWNDLRNVPSAYLSSRDETERFIFYDGPTRAKAPLSPRMLASKIIFDAPPPEPVRPYLPDSPFAPMAQNAGGKRGMREAFVIRVTGAKVAAWRFTLDKSGLSQAELPASFPINGIEDARKQFTQMLIEYGLTPAEARGLVLSWDSFFFQTPGTRLLLRMSAADYDRLCPISVKPAPTEMIRLGLILTELEPPPN